jgi:hypothetical protein
MPVPGKEIERQVIPEGISQPVELSGYVERVERQTETQQPSNPQPQQDEEKTENRVGDMGKIVSAQFAVQAKPNINLPYTEKEVVGGLHQKVWKSIRWASEYALMMIKKYPGRVFYLPPENK